MGSRLCWYCPVSRPSRLGRIPRGGIMSGTYLKKVEFESSDPHVCKFPGTFFGVRFVRAATDCPAGSVWRCNECNTLWKTRYESSSHTRWVLAGPWLLLKWRGKGYEVEA